MTLMMAVRLFNRVSMMAAALKSQERSAGAKCTFLGRERW